MEESLQRFEDCHKRSFWLIGSSGDGEKKPSLMLVIPNWKVIM